MTNIIQPSRRGFITGLTSLIVAPAIVRVESLMPVKVIKECSFLTLDEYINHMQIALTYGYQYFTVNVNEIKIIPLTEIYENKT